MQFPPEWTGGQHRKFLYFLPHMTASVPDADNEVPPLLAQFSKAPIYSPVRRTRAVSG